VLHYLANAGLLDRGLTVRALTLPDRLQDHDDQAAQYAEAGLDAQGILKTVLAATPAKAQIRPRQMANAARTS
jgi:1-deoxy-D-xylulose-5-phosphate synthase